MKTAARTGFVFVFFACAACGGEAPQVVTPPPLHITAKPPEPPAQRARWVFAHSERGFTSKLDLGDGSVLYIGSNGRRSLAKGSEPLADAATLALGDLVGVLKTPKGELAFVSADGSVMTSKDPLGNLDNPRPGPIGADHANAKLVSPTTGKAAILGIDPDGHLVRSADYGATWRPVDYAGGTKPYGHAASVALDSKGNGVLLHTPQRLFVTHDDGATWAPLGSLHMGARSVSRDGSDRVFVTGMHYTHAILEGNALSMTNDRPKPIYEAPAASSAVTAAKSDGERTDSKTLLTGDRVVEFAEITRHGKVREIEIGSAALGEKIDKPVPNTDLVGASGLSKHIAGYGRELVYLRDDDDSDEDKPTTTVYRSKDYGATWQKESQLQGVDAAEGEGLDIAAGPKGWVYVTSLCAKDENSGSSCGHRQIRPAGAAGYEDLVFVEEFDPTAFAFDEAHDKVYALGLHEGHQYVYESPLGQNKFSRTKLLEASSYAKTGISVDAKGTVRALEWDSSKSNWVVHRLGADGKDQPPLYVGIERGTLALTGARGVLFTRERGWETNDGGETWMRIATNGFSRDLVCSDGGCINGDAQRVGWDMPAVTNQEKVTAQTEPVKPTTSSPTPPPPRPYVAPKEITCKVSGTGSPVSSTPSTEMVDGVGADRWATLKHDTDSKTSIVVGTKNAVRELPLLAALPKPNPKVTSTEELRAGERVLPDGVVAARYRFPPRTPGGSYNPVDVELAWWSAQTGRTQHHTLPKVAAFRVSRYGFSGTPQIVDGGLLFQGSSGDAAYFVHDDGKVEPIAMPKNASIAQADRLAKRWILADTEMGAVQISASDDNGKTWKQTAWGLGTWSEVGSIGLTLVGDKATISAGGGYGGSSLHSLLFPIDANLPDDPPPPTLIDSSSVDTACDAKVGRHRFTQYISSDRRPIKVMLDSATMTPSTRVMHDAPNGKMCTSAYVMSGYSSKSGSYETAFVYPEANGTYSGWRFRRPEDRNKTGMIAEPLTCK